MEPFPDRRACAAPSRVAPQPRPGSRARRPRLARHLLAAGALLALAGCDAAGENEFPPPCPQVGVLPGGGDLTLWRGEGRDLTDLVLRARITGLHGDCRMRNKTTERTTLTVRMQLGRGPAATTRIADFTYFVAVADGRQILDKQAYSVRVDFPSNTDRMDYQTDPVKLLLPVTASRSGAAYEVWASFQLSPDEMRANFEHPPPPMP